VSGDATPPRSAQASQLELLVEAVSDYAIFLLDTEGHVQTWNRGAERIKGYTADEVLGRHFSIFYTPEDRDRGHPDHELQVALRDGRYEEEGWRVRKDGSRFWAGAVITTIRDAGGVATGFGKVTRDLTARRLYEEQMRSTADELRGVNRELGQFRRLVSAVRDYAIFMLDPAGNVATWNAGARTIKGYEASEIVGRHFSAFYTAEDQATGHPAAELERAAREGRHAEEGWRIRKDGSRFWASVTISAVRDDDGVLLGFAKVTRDLTERREADQALHDANARLARSNEELDRFAMVAAHDLSDPLRTVSGFAELLANQELPAEAAGYVQHLTAIADRMSGLLANLLEYARAGEPAGAAEPVDLAAATNRVLGNLAGRIGERGAQVGVDVAGAAVVAASAGDVEIVLQNLIANALKFGDPAAPRVEISAEPVQGDWRIVVADNGVGIDRADQERIFTAFERAHADLSRGGTGLGLSICDRLVRRHGGRMGVDSEPGQGARFWVLLPGALATS
jgi:PAS domain S-box-containing protein